ncbi:GNAT family N-acetyltransferase [Chloroflexota bacterium]
MRHPFIVGEKIYLRGLEKNDLTGNMFQWANDTEVTYYMFMGAMPNSIELLEEEYEQLIRSKNDVVFAIIDKKTDTHIGNVGLYVINWISRSAEFRIIIGEKEYWSNGYGTEATKLTAQYGFEKLNLNRVWLGVNAEHKDAIKAYENAGFVHEGTLRQEQYRNSRYYDVVRMSILREEYFAHKEGK